MFLWGVFFHIPRWLFFFSSFFFFSFKSGQFLLHILSWLLLYLGSFTYTSRAGFIFSWGVSLTHLMLALFLCGEFLLHVPCWLFFFFFFFLIWGVSLTHPVQLSFLCTEFLLHIQYWLHFRTGTEWYRCHMAQLKQTLENRWCQIGFQSRCTLNKCDEELMVTS